MADLNAVLQALVLADQQAKANSPYAPVSQFTEQMNPTILQAAGSGQYKPGESMAAGLINGLIGGFSQNLTNSYADKQNNLAYQAMSNAMTGKGGKPEGIHPSVFAPIQAAGSVFSVANAIENQNAARDAQNDLNKTITSETVKGVFSNPYRAQRAQQVLGQMFGQQAPAQTQPMVEQGSTSPESANYEGYLEQYMGDESLARAAVQRDIEAPDRNFKDTGALRDEFQKLPEVKAFVVSDIGYKSLQKALQDPAATSDLELIRGAIQAIEPGMAVREGEAAAVEGSASIPDEWKGLMNKALTGGSALDEKVRAGIVRIAERRYEQYANKFNAARGFYQSQAEKRGLDPEGITYLSQVEDMVQPKSQPLPGNATEGATATNPQTGQKIIFRQGTWQSVGGAPRG